MTFLQYRWEKACPGNNTLHQIQINIRPSYAMVHALLHFSPDSWHYLFNILPFLQQNSRFYRLSKVKMTVLRLLSVISLLAMACNQPAQYSPALSPEEELATFEIEAEFRIELVAAEPLVQDPVAMTFDEDGRLWVVEMPGFMQDIDGTGEEEPSGRVVVLSDSNRDGKMDERKVFLDSLVLPRAIAVVKGGILVAENIPLWYAEDLDGDLHADRKTLIDGEYGGRGLPEHSANGLWRGMDNWYYNAKSRTRYRMKGGAWIQEETEFRGQWGISHDNAGRLFYNYNWSQLHTDLAPPNYLSRNKNHKPSSGIDHGLTSDRRVYPIRPNTAVNRGYIPGTLDEEGKLKEFASACSPFIYRGDLFPGDYQGNAFVCDPSANILKRNFVEEKGFSLYSENAWPDREFLASTDERFRPVFLASGPDGALYITDMYHGIIQHGPYMTPYLREETLNRKLDRPVHLGRIWRIVPKDAEYVAREPLSGKSPADLTAFLSHPNGWYRDMAQRLLVERKDTSVIPLLENMVRAGDTPIGKLHALWTLEGLETDHYWVVMEALEDPDPFVQAAALRMLEPAAKSDPALREEILTLIKRKWAVTEPPALLQMALTLSGLSREKEMKTLVQMLTRYVEEPVVRDAVISGLEGREYALFSEIMDDPIWQDSAAGRDIFLELLSTAIVNHGKDQELRALLTLLEDDIPDWQQKNLLSGMALAARNPKQNNIRLTSKPSLFDLQASLPALDQQQIQSIASLFFWPGKQVQAEQNTENILSEAGDIELFTTGRQQYLTICAGCHGNSGEGLPRFAPPLKDSEWVLGDQKKLILILLHGMEGPVEVAGKTYDAPEILPVMPAMSSLGDAQIAAILTYIRNDWGNQAGAVRTGSVGRLRHRSQGKITPWKADDLSTYSFEAIGEELE